MTELSDGELKKLMAAREVVRKTRLERPVPSKNFSSWIEWWEWKFDDSWTHYTSEMARRKRESTDLR